MKGRCPKCARQVEQRRGTATARGYGAAWTRFRPTFIAMLIEAGIPPTCGAALPGGPVTTDSTCPPHTVFRSADGSDLHFDHEPPLEDWERQHVAIVCNPLRIQLLCQSDHARKGDGTFRPDAPTREVSA